MRLTPWLIIGTVAAVLCVSRPVRSEPHGDMPPCWSLEQAPDYAPAATLEQEDDACRSTN